MSKIKIAFIISNLGQGGAERQFLELIRNIDKSRFNVSVCLYAVNKGVFYDEIESVENIIFTKKILKHENKLLKILEAIFFIRNYLSKNVFDIVFTSLFMNGLLVRLAASRRNYKNKVVSTIRNSFSIYTPKHIFIEKYFIKRSYIVANSKSAANDFKAILKKNINQSRIQFIYNGYDKNRYYVSEKRKPDEKLIYGNVGRMTTQKNQIQLLRVFSGQKKDSYKLQIIGSFSDETEKLVSYVDSNGLKNCVELIDKVQNIEDYYKGMDIFILSSFYEGCPNVLFEAMLSKCFCIISKHANSDGFIINGINGYEYDGTDDDLCLVIEITRSVYNTEEGYNIIENGYKYAVENFSMEAMVSNYEKLFIDIYEKNQGCN
ncbi:MAG: hypothetical protein A2W93_04725 [Bacteroidetes bacterium GWF2_43_63]|nr:MAG: hypothetical protein A2W94_12715 [Bacteroidetes bacterium GWE2_42_42]OFY56060.1 MAG: hypothetical protein A2W93_04725 [Bacteroidetes bacterium GWF2_43_63]HBG70688.1 hypothetical protein [Bacteroidales bacterium]HCB62484.1 hypothetical protein [Bacteroidales bacterium]HCY21939.1 hypothetical protein [Bacteroidales bacterium]